MLKRLVAFIGLYFAKVADPCETWLAPQDEAVAKPSAAASPKPVDNYDELKRAMYAQRIKR